MEYSKIKGDYCELKTIFWWEPLLIFSLELILCLAYLCKILTNKEKIQIEGQAKLLILMYLSLAILDFLVQILFSIIEIYALDIEVLDAYNSIIFVMREVKNLIFFLFAFKMK